MSVEKKGKNLKHKIKEQECKREKWSRKTTKERFENQRESRKEWNANCEENENSNFFHFSIFAFSVENWNLFCEDRRNTRRMGKT